MRMPADLTVRNYFCYACPDYQMSDGTTLSFSLPIFAKAFERGAKKGHLAYRSSTCTVWRTPGLRVLSALRPLHARASRQAVMESTSVSFDDFYVDHIQRSLHCYKIYKTNVSFEYDRLDG